MPLFLLDIVVDCMFTMVHLAYLMKLDFFFFFLIDNRTFSQGTEYHVHDGEHSGQETNTTSSRT